MSILINYTALKDIIVVFVVKPGSGPTPTRNKRTKTDPVSSQCDGVRSITVLLHAFDSSGLHVVVNQDWVPIKVESEPRRV